MLIIGYSQYLFPVYTAIIIHYARQAIAGNFLLNQSKEG